MHPLPLLQCATATAVFCSSNDMVRWRAWQASTDDSHLATKALDGLNCLSLHVDNEPAIRRCEKETGEPPPTYLSAHLRQGTRESNVKRARLAIKLQN